MKRLAAPLGIVAMLSLANGAPAATGPMRVPMCHGGFTEFPIKGQDLPAHDKSCPFGCHAPLCQERKRRPGTV